MDEYHTSFFSIIKGLIMKIKQIEKKEPDWTTKQPMKNIDIKQQITTLKLQTTDWVRHIQNVVG